MPIRFNKGTAFRTLSRLRPGGGTHFDISHQIDEVDGEKPVLATNGDTQFPAVEFLTVVRSTTEEFKKASALTLAHHPLAMQRLEKEGQGASGNEPGSRLADRRCNPAVHHRR